MRLSQIGAACWGCSSSYINYMHLCSYMPVGLAFHLVTFFPPRDGDKMAPSVEKKIAELEMGLLHLQQNIEIPEISLPIHPIITNVAKQCYEHGEKPKVTDFGDKVEDPTFLNQLQSGVNRWIREIQKVKLQNQMSDYTVETPVSFFKGVKASSFAVGPLTV